MNDFSLCVAFSWVVWPVLLIRTRSYSLYITWPSVAIFPGKLISRYLWTNHLIFSWVTRFCSKSLSDNFELLSYSINDLDLDFPSKCFHDFGLFQYVIVAIFMSFLRLIHRIETAEGSCRSSSWPDDHGKEKLEVSETLNEKN